MSEKDRDDVRRIGRGFVDSAGVEWYIGSHARPDAVHLERFDPKDGQICLPLKEARALHACLGEMLRGRFNQRS